MTSACGASCFRPHSFLPERALTQPELLLTRFGTPVDGTPTQNTTIARPNEYFGHTTSAFLSPTRGAASMCSRRGFEIFLFLVSTRARGGTRDGRQQEARVAILLLDIFKPTTS